MRLHVHLQQRSLLSVDYRRHQLSHDYDEYSRCRVDDRSDGGPVSRDRATSRLLPRQHRYAGRWILVDARMRLIAVGDKQYDGISPKTAMDHVGKFALLPSLQACAHDGQERRASPVVKGRRWSVHVQPVRAPFNKVLLAVQACYVPEGQPFPPLPLVGAWEWEISPPGPDQVMRAYWSCAQYRIHGMQHKRKSTNGCDWELSRWDVPRWLDELIVPADRADMRRTIERAIGSPSDALLTHYFRARSPDTGSVHHLRVAGWRWTDNDESPPWWWRGITLGALPEHTRGAHRPATGPLLDATLTLSRDPLFVVDVSYEHVYLTSSHFAELDLAVPDNRHLPTMCHPQDLPSLRAMLAACTARSGSGNPSHSVAIRLATRKGSWMNVVLSGIGVDTSETGDSPHVLCRVQAAPAT